MNPKDPKQAAADALIACGVHGVKNQGHAYIIIKDAGITDGWKHAKHAIAAFEKYYGVTLELSKAQKLKQEAAGNGG